MGPEAAGRLTYPKPTAGNAVTMSSSLPEQFHTRFRFTSTGLAFNLGGILGGAVPPLIAGARLQPTGAGQLDSCSFSRNAASRPLLLPKQS